MATDTKAATEDVKMDLFEDDDEFEEFQIDEGVVKASVSVKVDVARLGVARDHNDWDNKEEGKEATQQWEDDWDDDDVNDDFSLQLRRELESNAEKKS